MCGVIGYKPTNPDVPEATQAFRRLFYESTIRGQHAYGITSSISSPFKSFDWDAIPNHFDPWWPTIAHTRYCQSGDWQIMANNQPLVVLDLQLAMNGVIHMGTKEEFEKAYDVQCQVDNDSEIFLQKLKQGVDPHAFVKSITGSFAAVWLKGPTLYAMRNERRPLYWIFQYGAWWVASTRDIFLRAGFKEPKSIEPYVLESYS